MDILCEVCGLSIVTPWEQAPRYFRDRELGIVFSRQQHDVCHRRFAEEKTGFEVLDGRPKEIPEKMRDRLPSASEGLGGNRPAAPEPSEDPVIHVSGRDVTFQFGRSKIIPPKSMPLDRVFRQLGRARPGKPKTLLGDVVRRRFKENGGR